MEFADLIGNAPSGYSQRGSEYVYSEFYVDGVRSGDQYLWWDSRAGRLEVADLDAFLLAIPDARNGLELVSLVATELDDQLLCVVSMRTDCSIDDVDRIRLVFDPQTPRLDLYRSRRFVERAPPVRPSHPRSAGLLGTFSLRTSGSQRSGRNRSAVRYDLVGGLGDISAYANGALLGSGELLTRGAGMQRYWKNLRAGAGMFEASRSPHLSQIGLIGVELGSARLGVAAGHAEAQPLVVFLEQESVVEVFRGGELLGSRNYPAGMARIDTSSFPRGTYALDINIHSQSGEHQLFNRSFVSAAQSITGEEPNFSVQIGATRTAERAGVTDNRARELFVGMQLNRGLENQGRLRGRAGLLGGVGFAELELMRQLSTGWLSASGLLTSRENYGLAVSASSNVLGARLNAQFRKTRNEASNSVLRRAGGTTREFNIGLNTDLKRLGGQVSAFLRWSKRPSTEEELGVGVDWFRRLKRFPGERPLLRVGYQHSAGAHRLSISIRTSLRRGRFRAAAEHRENYRSGGSFSLSQRDARQSLSTEFTARPGAENHWAAALNLERSNSGVGRFSGDALIERDAFAAEGFFQRGLDSSDAVLYGGGITTTVAMTENALSFSRHRAQSGVVIDLRDTLADSAIDALVNSSRTELQPGRLYFKAMTTLTAHSVAFSAADNLSLGYSSKSLQVTPFPGQVVRLDPKLFRQITLFGQLVDRDDIGMKGYQVLTGESPQPLDDQGYFVVDVPMDTQQLHLEDANGESCQVALPNFGLFPQETYRGLGMLRCD